VRTGRKVLDARDAQSRRGEGADGAFPAIAGAMEMDLNLAHAGVDRKSVV
jgi:hypothetical protein